MPGALCSICAGTSFASNEKFHLVFSSASFSDCSQQDTSVGVDPDPVITPAPWIMCISSRPNLLRTASHWMIIFESI